MSSSETHSTERNGVIERAASVLFAFSADKPRMTLGEIAAEAGLPPSTVRRLLVQLAQTGLVEQDEDSALYSLSLKLVGLGAVALENVDIVRLARPSLQGLTETTHEAAFLGRLEPQGVVYLSVIQPSVSIRVSTRAGEVRPVHVTSIGKTLLAHLSDEELGSWLAENPLLPLTPNALTDQSEFITELHQIRERGYGTNYQESSIEFASVAAPVRDHHNMVVAAMAISGPAYRIGPGDMARLGDSVVAAADELSRRLGNRHV